jgi:hypothetical protein
VTAKDYDRAAEWAEHPAAAPGEKSPVRQVRLPRALDADPEAFASSRKRKPSEIMREALTEYLETHREAG